MDIQKTDNNITGRIVDIASVSKSFLSKRVLNNIDFSIMPGESVCLCGINGAGKSTMLRIISGLLQPDKGSVKIKGFDIARDPEKTKSHLGVISHKSMVYSDLTVLENVRFFATLYGVDSSEQHLNELLKDVGLFSFRYDKAAVLSRGLLQRLAIVRALVHKPDVLLADEPFTGLDTKACKHLVSVLNNFRQSGGTTIMTTHDIRLGLKCCDRVVVLDKAKLIFDAKISDIDSSKFVEDYVEYSREHG